MTESVYTTRVSIRRKLCGESNTNKLHVCVCVMRAGCQMEGVMLPAMISKMFTYVLTIIHRRMC